MKKHPVILSSNLPNRYGFRIDTRGIDLSLVNKNPVVLYMHLRANQVNPQIRPIGKAMDFALNENQELTANLVFNQKNEFAREVEQDFEDGYLNTVSIRGEIQDIDPREELYFPNQTMPTVTKLLLEEISVVDIPGDSGASAIRLHHQGKESIEIALAFDNQPDLSKLFPTKQKSEMSKLIQLALQGQKHVTLAKDASEDEQVKCITELIGVADKTVELKADLSKKEAEIIQLKQDNEALKNAAVDEKAEALVQLAVDAKKITPAQKAEYVTLAKTNYDSVKNILDSMKGFTSLSKETPEESKDEKFVSLSWDELDKKNLLAELKASNKDLYDEKFEARFGRKPQS